MVKWLAASKWFGTNNMSKRWLLGESIGLGR